jgi:hypothetical protein
MCHVEIDYIARTSNTCPLFEHQALTRREWNKKIDPKEG